MENGAGTEVVAIGHFGTLMQIQLGKEWMPLHAVVVQRVRPGFLWCIYILGT